MAQLKDLLVQGPSRFIGDMIGTNLQITKILAPTTAGGSEYNIGTNGQALLSNGSSLYWGNVLHSDYSLGAAVGSGTTNHLAYYNSGTSIVALNSSVGNGAKPIYLNSGVPVELTSTVGNGAKPVYLSSGTITALTSSVGSTTRPVYLNSGAVAQVSYDLQASVLSGSANGLAMYSTANSIKSVGPGANETVLIYSGQTPIPTFQPAFGGLAVGTGTNSNVISASIAGIARSITLPLVNNGTSGGSYGTNVRFVTVKTDGVMEVGRYIDLHATGDTTRDYDVRLDATDSTTARTFTFNKTTGGEFVTHTAATKVGSNVNPVYVNSTGAVAAIAYSLNATIGSASANQLAVYTNANTIGGQTLAWDTWTAGTTAGPIPKIKVGSTVYTGSAIPSAGENASGIITTSTQTFSGEKTFKGNILPHSTLTYNLGSTTLKWKNIYAQRLNGIASRIDYLSSSTAAGTAAKTATCDGFTLDTGAEIYIIFTIQNTAANPTLNINSTGAKNIFQGGARVTTRGLRANYLYHMLYDGTQWIILNDHTCDPCTCSTPAGTAAKVATCDGFVLYAGAILQIRFSNRNSHATPTLNINGYGAKSIKIAGATTANTYRFGGPAELIYTLRYDGTQFELIHENFQHRIERGTSEVKYTQQEYDDYYTANGEYPTWNVGDVKTAAQEGFENIGLGNATASNTNNGMTGRLALYSPSTSYTAIQAQSAPSSKTFYLPRYNGDMYATHVSSNSAVGSHINGVFVAADGRITPMSSTVGSNTKPIFMNAGSITAFSATIGSNIKPVFVNSGNITAFSATVGSNTKPMFMNSGSLTAFSATVGSHTKPIFMSGGTLTAISGTVGAGNKLVYLSSGTFTASTSSVGSNLQPVYLNAGTVTAGAYTLNATLNSGTAGQVAYYSGTNAVAPTSVMKISSNDVVLATSSRLIRPGYNASWSNSVNGSLVVQSSTSGWNPALAIKANSGWWLMGHYRSNNWDDQLIIGFLANVDVGGVANAQNHLDYKLRIRPTVYATSTTTTTEHMVLVASYNQAVGNISNPVYIPASGVATAVTPISLANGLINSLTTGSDVPKDSDYFISQYANGGTTTTTYHRRQVVTLWSYVRSKIIDSLYWANIKVSSASSTATQPKFADVDIISPASNSQGRINFQKSATANDLWGFVGPAREATLYGIYVNSVGAGSSKSFYLTKYRKSDGKVTYADTYNYNDTYLAGSQIDTTLSYFAIWNGYEIRSITKANAINDIWDGIDSKITTNRQASGAANAIAYYTSANKIAGSSVAYFGNNNQTLNINGTAATSQTVKLSLINSKYQLSFDLGNSGNRGIYQDTDSKWLLYWINDSNTTTIPSGSLVVSGGSISSSTSSTTERDIYTENSVAKVGLDSAASGNRGIYDWTSDRWMIFTHKDTNTVRVQAWQSIGSTTKPTYFNASGYPAAVAYNLQANVNAGTTGRLTYYSAANTIAPAASINVSARGFYINDGNATWPALIYYNGSNTWVNAAQTATNHVRGGLYLSAGYNTSNSNGNPSVYICVPNSANTGGTNYYAYHRGVVTLGTTAPTTSTAHLIGDGSIYLQYTI